MSSKTPLYNSLFPTKYDEDDFGYSPELTNEIEKWLTTAKDINEEIYNKQKSDATSVVCSPRHRRVSLSRLKDTCATINDENSILLAVRHASYDL